MLTFHSHIPVSRFIKVVFYKEIVSVGPATGTGTCAGATTYLRSRRRVVGGNISTHMLREPGATYTLLNGP